MAGPKIALFANHDSNQLSALHEILEDQGARSQMFDIKLGGDTAPTVTMEQDRLCWNGVTFDDIQAIHVRCTALNTLPVLPPMLNEMYATELRLAFLREQHFQAVTFSFFDNLAAQGKLVINPLTSAYIDHDSKSQLYEKLRAWGFDAPMSLSTNDPAQASKFIDSYAEVVVKPALGVGSTRVISPQDMERLQEFTLCPVIMQERVMGDTIRVHIVGDHVVLALKILNDGNVDSRTETKGFEFFTMPEEQQRKITDATRRLGLRYAAWDIIATEQGRYSYLDCNPGPYIMWIGPENVRRVFTELARYMITFANTGSLEAASAAVTPATRH